MEHKDIPQQFAKHYATVKPDLWKWIDSERQSRSIDGKCPWDARCLLPDDVWFAFAEKYLRGMSVELATSTVDSLMAISAWRPTQDIALIDEAVLEALLNSSVDKLPVEVLGHLPPWCVYVPFPKSCWDLSELDVPVVGVFFYYGVANGEGTFTGKSGLELRIFPVLQGKLGRALPVPLSPELDTIGQALDAQWQPGNKPDNPELEYETKQIVARMISVLLYVITEMEKTYGNSGCTLSEARPCPVKTKKGFRLFPPKKNKEWHLGREIGNKLRRETSSVVDSEDSHEERKRRPHIRRGHWQLYWTGRRKFKEGEVPVRQTPKLVWKPISLVAGYIDENAPEE